MGDVIRTGKFGRPVDVSKVPEELHDHVRALVNHNDYDYVITDKFIIAKLWYDEHMFEVIVAELTSTQTYYDI